jgi:16S rRNA (cytidine1402-2'-O)-methyltransferase
MDSGVLYIIATPIGNMNEVSERMKQTLAQVDFIAAEDTRVSGNLLKMLNIKNKLVSNHKFNEGSKIDYFINELSMGKSIAVISDAGTPCISDPGFLLVQAAVAHNITVIGVSGPCAAIVALSVSGFDCTAFTFYGFFPRHRSDSIKFLETIKLQHSDLSIFYESPNRILSTIKLLMEYCPDYDICLCNDLTKKFEKIYRGNPEIVYQELMHNTNSGKGEYTLVIKRTLAADDSLVDENPEVISIEAQIVDCLLKQHCTLKDTVELLHSRKDNPYSKKEIYAATLNLKRMFEVKYD